jgi:hypothetical protein
MGYPRRGRVGGGAEDAYPAGGALDDRQDIHADAGRRRRLEEVSGDDGAGLGAQERCPGVACSLGCRVDTGVLEDFPHGGGGDRDAQHEQFAVDSVVPPRAVLAGQAQHQPADRPDRWWPPDPCGPADRRVPVSDQVAVPAQHGLRTSSRDIPEYVAGQPVQQCGEKRRIGRGEPDLLAVQVPFEDCDLVPEREDLDVLARSLIDRRRSSARVLVTPR